MTNFKYIVIIIYFLVNVMEVLCKNIITVTVASVAVNIVTLNYVMVARVALLLSLSIIMAFRVLKCS